MTQCSPAYLIDRKPHLLVVRWKTLTTFAS